MKKSTKVILIIALCMLLSGIAVCAGGLFMTGFDFTIMDTVSYREVTTTSDEAFTEVEVSVMSSGVQVFVSTGDELRVESTESDKLCHQVEVKGDVLAVRQVDTREWYEYIGINFSFADESVKIYLPERMYENIKLKSSSGKIVVNEGITCESLEAISTSGAVRVYGVTAEDKITANATSGQAVVDGVSTQELSVSSTSGKVNVSNVSNVESLRLNATSGKIEVTDVTCEELKSENVSGGITCSGVICTESLSAKTTSGSIKVLQSDAQNLTLKSTSGGIRGTLLSDKVFITDTVSGSINVPRTTQGGVCKAETTSGSIDIKIQ